MAPTPSTPASSRASASPTISPATATPVSAAACGIFYDSRQAGIFNNRIADVTPFSPQLTFTPAPGPFSDPLRGVQSPFPAPFPPPKDSAFPQAGAGHHL